MPPIFYLTVAYISGIIAAKGAGLPLWFILVSISCILPANIYLFYRKQHIFPLLLCLVFCAGLFYAQLKLDTVDLSFKKQLKPSNQIEITTVAVRERLTAIPQKLLPEPYSTLLSGIVLGSRAVKLPLEMNEAYRRAGVSHLLVASGMQLAIFVGLFVSFARGRGFPPVIILVIGTLLNLLASLVMGGGPSVLRAAFMCEASMLALVFERQSDFSSIFSLSALKILLLDPLTLFDIGFQLSFAATWSLVYLASPLAVIFKRYLPEFMANLFSVSLAPVLATTPITAFNFNQVSLVAVFTNCLVLPWVSAILILGLISIFLGLVSFPLAYLVGSANLVLLWILNWLINSIASFPWATFSFATPSFVLMLGYYLLLILWVEKSSGRLKFEFSVFHLMAMGLLLLCFWVWNFALFGMDLPLRVTVLDVGQGDAVLIEVPEGEKILVDGGDQWKGQGQVLRFLRKQGINTLDKVVLTHPHADHLAGLLEVLPQLKVKEVIDSGRDDGSLAYRQFLALINKNKIKYQVARAGQVQYLTNGATLQILGPCFPYLEGTNSDPNNNSVVFRLVYHNFSMLFTGDAEKEEEEALLGRFPVEQLYSQVLKVGHHGSATASSLPFLRAVNPDFAVISCGRRNKFRHPHRSTLQRLKEQGARVYRTDLEGSIIVDTDGRRVRIETVR